MPGVVCCAVPGCGKIFFLFRKFYHGATGGSYIYANLRKMNMNSLQCVWKFNLGITGAAYDSIRTCDGREVRLLYSLRECLPV